MERDPPLIPPDTSRPSRFATQSVTCNSKGGIVCCVTFFTFEPGEGFEL